jgi:superfamily II DNA or RNA helicase
MHGFAQRVLPLLAEPEAASPNTNKHSGEVSRRSGDYLWQLYQALPQEYKMLVRLKALIEPTIGKAAFLEVVRKAGLRSPDGKAYASASLNAELHALQRKGLLNDALDCASELIHVVAVEACASESAANLIGAIQAAIPKSDREHVGRQAYYYLPPIHQDFALFRRFRLAIYANDEAEFSRLYKLVGAATWGPEGRPTLIRFLAGFPLTKTWLETLRLAIREMFAEHSIRMFVEQGRQTAETDAIVEHYAGMAPREVGASSNKLLLRLDILSANFDRARLRIEALPESEAHLAEAHKASIAFLTGDNESALVGFRNAQKLLRASLGKRKVAFEAEAGLFHMLALLRANDQALRTELRSLIDAATAEATPFSLAHRSVEALLELVEGRHDKAQRMIEQLLEQPSISPAVNAIVILAALFIDSGLVAKRAALNEAEFSRFVESMPLLARIRAEILSRTAKNRAIWQERAATLGGGSLIAFTEIISIMQPWERAFDTLTAFLKPAEPKRPAEKAPAKAKRLAWLVDLASGEVSVVEQSAKGSGWTGGRPVALKRLHQLDARLDYLTEHDQRMRRCLRKDKYLFGEGLYYFDEYATLPNLVGHPNVYNAACPSERIELIAYPVELVVKKTAGGYNFNLSHRAEEPKAFLEMETPTRWRVVELSRKLLELQATLGDHGLNIPRDMRERVASLLNEANPTVPIRSELADIDVPATPGDATPVMQLQRRGDGLRIRIGVRPFGADGPFYFCGQGGASILGAIDGRRQRVNRDLDAEKDAMDALIKACPALTDWGFASNECEIEAPEDVLEFLEQAQAYEGAVTFEWPEGEALKVSRTIGAQKLSIKLTQKRDWFEVSGKIEVDEDLVVDMAEVLARLDRAQGRFVPLDNGRFIALTKDLQRQLRRLEGVSEEAAGGRRLHGLASMAVDDLVESAGKVQADKHWRELSARIRAAGSHTPKIPATLEAELRDYQAEGFAWMSRLANLQMGACLADDMGLGKTVQTIAVILEQQAHGACLVVAPTSVCHNWEVELARFAPSLNVHRLAAAQDRASLIEVMGPGDVLIASYGLLHQEDEALTSRAWNILVLDEAQNLKNADTKRAKASQKIEAKFRVALSGTPIENYLDELWSLFNTINPGLLGSRESFQRRFAGPIERDRKPAARDALRALIRPFILRRTKSAVLSELPPRTELTIRVQMPEDERAFYEAMRRQAMENIAALDGPAGQRKIHILAEIGKLRRLCCHPALIDPKTSLESAKLAAFLELADELLRNRHKALVFSQFLGHLEKVREALDARGVRYQYLDGGVAAQARSDRVAAFQAGEGDLFLISLKAGGVGLNLTAADYVIHLDPWWNPAVEDQASDRAHRIGQHRPVTVYRLVVEDSIEERILDLHKHKRDLAADLLDGAEVSARMTEDELLALIRR